jgi:hypothetical protein
MITEYLLFTQIISMRTSEVINMLHNQTQMAEAEYAFLTGLTGFEKFKHKVKLFFQERDSDW